MKKSKFYTTLFLAALLFPALSFAQNANQYLLQQAENFSPDVIESLTKQNNQSTLEFRGDEDLLLTKRTDGWIDNEWVNTGSTEYYYNSDNLLVQEVTKAFVDDAWVDNTRRTYEYDSNGNLTLTTYQDWGENSWITDRQIIQEYNTDNIITFYLYQNWDDSTWINDFQWSLQYNLSDSTYISMREDWDGSTWVNAVKNSWANYYDYSFDNVSSLTQQFWNNTNADWDNNLRVTFSYGDNNESTGRLFEDWDGTNWIVSSRITNAYDDGSISPTSILGESWDGTNWLNDYLATYTYDTNNNQIAYLYQIWVNDEWSDNFGRTSEYDAYNNLTQRITQIGIGLSNSSRDTYYYQILSSTSQAELEHPVQIFPNPSNYQLTIDLGENQILFGQANIYNLQGQLLLTELLKGNQQTTLALNGFVAGTYYLQILADERQTTQTFIVAP